MPASEVMPKFKAHKLHSGGPSGPVVTNPKQAVAIMLSEKKKAAEGKQEYQEPNDGAKKLASRFRRKQ